MGDFYAAVRKFKEANESLTAAGKPFVVPESFVTNLTTQTDNAANAWEMAKTEKRESAQAYDSQEDIFNEDTQKLRVVYQHGVLAWGKSNPLLEDLGFYPLVPKHGGQTPPAPQNLEYDAVMGRFSWLESEGATSYQLAYHATGSSNDWEEAYTGSDTSVTFNPGNGNWEFKVRARNENGYGDWSSEITVTIGLQPPVIWELVYNPSTNKVTLQWHASIGADFHDVYQSVVPLGQGAEDFTMIQSIAGQVYQHDVTTYDVTEYYYVIARNASGSSDPSEIVFVDVAVS